jgi:hypothetical protein
MNQMTLFESQPEEKKRPNPPAIAIRTGRVGAIRFGATATSFRMTREVLTDLDRPAEDDEPPA